MQKDLVSSFPALCTKTTRVLILGTAPSVKSLSMQQYYAHPQNAFWPIAAEFLRCFRPEIWFSLSKAERASWRLGKHSALEWQTKIQSLLAAGLGLWDVLASCQRRASSDSSISAVRANPIGQLCEQYPCINAICLNGSKASQLFASSFPDFSTDFPHISVCKLPSTSPANAAVPIAEKQSLWLAALAAEA